MRSVVDLDDLPHTAHAHEFVGADHGDVPVSLILVHSAPGAGPAVHRHPYQIVIGPADIPHGFTNTGSGELRLTPIHCASAFKTDWVAAPDPQWTSQPKVGGRKP